MGDDFFICPVCVNKCQSIHIDGHRKIYRFKKVMQYDELNFAAVFPSLLILLQESGMSYQLSSCTWLYHSLV